MYSPKCLQMLIVYVLVLAVIPNANAQAGYTVTDLGSLDGTVSDGYGINLFGQITGSFGRPVSAFLYGRGTMTDLGNLGGDFAIGQGINDFGQVTGYSGTEGGGVLTRFCTAEVR